jgi:MFS family permease
MFLLLRAAQLSVPNASIPLLWAAQSGVAMLLTAPLSSLSDRLPRLWLIAGGWLLYAAVFGVLGATVDTLAGIAALLALYGLVLALTEGVEKALVADLVPPHRLGTAFGWFHLVTGLGLVPASAGFGWVWERFGVQAAFGASGAIAAAAAVALLVSMRGAGPAAAAR